MVPIDKGPGDDLCDYAGFQRFSFAYVLTPSLEYNRIQRTLIFCLSSREVRRCSSFLILWLSQSITVIGSGWSELISFPHVFTKYPSFGWQYTGHQALEVSRISASHSQAKVMLPCDTDLTCDALNPRGKTQSVSADVYEDRAAWEEDPGWGLGHLGQVLALPRICPVTLASE